MENLSFDKTLDRCLEELARTGDVEASLQRYPEDADALRPLLETALDVRRCYQELPAPPGRLAAGRERMLAVAAQLDGADPGPAAAPRTVGGRRLGGKRLFASTGLVAVLLAIAIALAAGAGAVWAAGTSLPGHWLFPVKVATEDVRLALARAPEARVALSLRLIEERVAEIEALAAAGQRVPDQSIARLEQHVARALAEAARSSDVEMGGLLISIADRARACTQVLAAIEAAETPDRGELARAREACWRGAEAADDAINNPDQFRWRYHQEGAPEPLSVPEQASATPGSSPEPADERELQPSREPARTPGTLPTATPDGKHVTPARDSTPVPPTATSDRQATAEPPRGTPSAPTAEPPRGTPSAPTAGPQPQEPGGDNGTAAPGGGGQEDGGQGGSGQGGGNP